MINIVIYCKIGFSLSLYIFDEYLFELSSLKSLNIRCRLLHTFKIMNLLI